MIKAPQAKSTMNDATVNTPETLAEQQAALVAALTGQGAAPRGFNPTHFQAAAVALADKRVRSAAHAWPVLFHALGEHSDGLFAEYARSTPLRQQGGPLADGRLFARWLTARDKLPASACMKLMAFDLRFAIKPEGIIPRRWPTIRMARSSPRRFVFAIRIPRLGEYWWRW